MRIFTIPEWGDQGGLTHYATTWQLASDIDFTNILAHTDEDTDNINSWRVNVEVPIGKVYYVRALRHLKDSDGNVVENDAWLGPIKIINKDSSQRDILIPKLHLSDPVIKSIRYENNDLIIDIEPSVGNVPVKSISWIVKSPDNKILYSDINNTDNAPTKTISNIDLFTHGHVNILVRTQGELGVLTNLVKETFDYLSNIYKLEGSIDNFDLTADTNTINLVKLDNDISLEIMAARVVDNNNYILTNCTINKHNIIVDTEDVIGYNGLVLALDLKLTDANGNSKNITKLHPISINRNMEYSYNLNIGYNYNLTQVLDDTDIFITDNFISEESANKDILIPTSDGTLKILNVNKTNNKYSIDIDTGIKVDTSKPIITRFHKKDEFHVIDYDSEDSTYRVRIYSFNLITKSVNLLKTFDITANDITVKTGSIYVVDSEMYVFYADDNKIKVNRYFITSGDGSNILEKSIAGIDTIKSVSACPITKYEVILKLNTPDTTSTYKFKINDYNVYRMPAIDDEFKEVHTYMKRLNNGNVLMFKLNGSDSLNFTYLSIKDKQWIKMDVDSTGVNNIKSALEYKNGDVDLIIVNNDDTQDVYRFV